jgi:hypothetical protein
MMNFYPVEDMHITPRVQYHFETRVYIEKLVSEVMQYQPGPLEIKYSKKFFSIPQRKENHARQHEILDQQMWSYVCNLQIMDWRHGIRPTREKILDDIKANDHLPMDDKIFFYFEKKKPAMTWLEYYEPNIYPGLSERYEYVEDIDEIEQILI